LHPVVEDVSSNSWAKTNWPDKLHTFTDGISQLPQLLKAHKEEVSELDSKSYARPKFALAIPIQVASGL
jgi:hypothetical protein